MNGFKKTALLILAVVFSVTLFGCGKKADPNKPIADVQAEADKMDVAKLKQMAVVYKDAIMAKQKDVEKIMAKIQEMGIEKAMSDNAKALQADIAKLNEAIVPLTERFEIYYNKLKEKGGDISGLSL